MFYVQCNLSQPDAIFRRTNVVYSPNDYIFLAEVYLFYSRYSCYFISEPVSV